MSRWPIKKSFFWQQAPFFRLLVPMIIAIIFYDQNWLPAGPVSSTAFLVSSIAFIVVCFFKRLPALIKIFGFVFLQIAVFSFGWMSMQRNDVTTNQNWFAKNKSGAHLVKVMEEPTEKERTWRMPIAIVKSSDSNSIVSGKAFLSIYKAKDSSFDIGRGDLLMVSGNWLPITNSGNPFEFDYATFCRRKNITHQQLVAPEEVSIYKKATVLTPGLLESCHDFCQARLDRFVTDKTTRGILQAMLLGDEQGFDPALRQAYAETGVIHIVSISGSHVGVLFFVITTLLFWLKGKRGQWMKYIVGVVFVWLYVLMAGAPPSALRSALMFSVIAISIMNSKQSHPLNTLMAAAFILLSVNPGWLFTVGFQLSFGAVLSLMIFFEPIFLAWPQTTKIGRWLWGAIAASIAAEILTAPLSIYYFHNFPLFFAVANIFAAFLLGLVAMIGGMAIIAFSWIPSLAAFIGKVLELVVFWFNIIILRIQEWSPTSFKYLQLSTVGLLLFYAAIAGFSISILQKKTNALLLGMGSLTFLLVVLCTGKYQLLQQERLVVYNINKQNIVERISGNRFYPLSDSATAERYVTKQAHTGWQAWVSGKSVPHSDYFDYKGRRVLIMNDHFLMADGNQLPVDVLIANVPLKNLSPFQLQQTFHPKTIVASGSQPRWVLKKWKDSCLAIGQSFHAVTMDGTFILE